MKDSDYTYKLMVRLYQLLDRGQRYHDAIFLNRDFPWLLKVTQLYDHFSKEALTLRYAIAPAVHHERHLGPASREISERIFDWVMADQKGKKDDAQTI